MNTQWMTTLFSKSISKGLALESVLRGSLQNLQDQLKKELEKRGIRATPEDLAAFIEDLSPQASRGFLDLALKYFRPFSQGLGYRISQLSDQHVEINIPKLLRNSHPQGGLHEAVLVAAGQEAQRLLWTRHAPMGGFAVEFLAFEFDKQTELNSDVRCRMDLPETLREATLSELREKLFVELENQIDFFNNSEQTVARLSSKIKLVYQPALQNSRSE